MFNLADLDSARTNEQEGYSARRGLHENQKLTNLASKYINAGSTELIPQVEKRAVPIPPNTKVNALYQHNSAEKRLKRSKGPDQPVIHEEAIPGAIAAMSQSFLSGSNAQGKLGPLRDTPRFRRQAQKTSSLTASQN